MLTRTHMGVSLDDVVALTKCPSALVAELSNAGIERDVHVLGRPRTIIRGDVEASVRAERLDGIGAHRTGGRA